MREISLREFFERILNESDKRYEERFVAQEKAVKTAFESSDKAIEKAEVAQRLYNEKSNEIRAQLNEQAATFIPKLEAINRFDSLDDKLVRLEKTFEDKINSLKAATEKVTDGQANDIKGLRESRSEGTGKSLGANALWGYIAGAIGLVVGLAALILKFSGN